MKIIIIAFVVGLAILLAYRSFHHAPSPEAEKKTGFFGAFHQAAEGDKSRLGVGKESKQRGSYDVYSEQLRAECGKGFIRTDGGQYEVGRMSNKGLVVAIQNRVVRVSGPDGRPGFVVCDDSSEMLPADRSANAKAVIGTPLAAGTGAADRKEMFRTGGASDGGLPAVVPAPVVGSQPAKSPDGPKPKNAADWWPSAVPGW